MACSGLFEECAAISGLRGILQKVYLQFCRHDRASGLLDRRGRPIRLAFTGLSDALVQAPILSFPTEDGDYILDTDASNLGLGGVLSQIQDNVKRVIAYCSRALQPSQQKYCTTKREMLAAVSMCIQFRSNLRGTKFTLRMDHKSLVWLHRFKDTEGMMARWLHTLQQFQFSIIHLAGHEHGNADGLSRAQSTPRLPNGGQDSGIV